MEHKEFLLDFGLVPTFAQAVVSGQTYGRLFVVATGQIPGTNRYMAVCKCTCGSPLKVVRQDHLIAGKSVSCGCFQRKQSTVHGLHSSPHYMRWRHMMDRCYNENCKGYVNYGGRGISVCVEWRELAGFIRDLPGGYWAGAELDRIDNDGNYEPGNVRWVNKKDNCNNRRSCHQLTYNGITKTMTEWAEEYDLDMRTVWDRVVIWGWDVEKALLTPVADRHENMLKAQSLRWQGHIKADKPAPRILKLYTYQGKEYTMAELSELSGVEVNLLRKRINERKWSVERAVNKVV